jgi:hypothetical protein
MEVMARYNLEDFNNITFNGFNCELPEETLSLISELAQQVGSPTYIRTPVFPKRETNSIKNGGSSNTTDSFTKRKRKNKATEVLTDADWESIRTFQATKIERNTEGINADIDMLRSWLNKMTEKNYGDLLEKILEVLNKLIEAETTDEDMTRVGNEIFEIASNNRFYSKIYADLYSELINKYDVLKRIFESSLKSFLGIFENIEKGNPDEDYDNFCRVNRDNERRKSLSSFFVNLTINGMISQEKLIELTINLLKKVQEYIMMENMKSEVDETVENIAILYNKEWFANATNEVVDGLNFIEVIEKMARSKAKTYSSLSNKSIFKFMDMIEM